MKSRNGTILVLVLFILMLMSAFSLTVGYMVRQQIQMATRLENREKLRYIAEAGVKKAIYLLNDLNDKQARADALNQEWSRNSSAFQDIPLGDGIFSVLYSTGPQKGQKLIKKEQVQYGMIDEERKINLNLTKSPVILTRLLKYAAGINEEDAKALADSILDWKDEDDFPSAAGAESRYYRSLSPAYQPKNANFGVLEELLYVKGMTPLILEKLRPFVTLNGTGKVNLNTASEIVLISIGLNPSLVKKILDFRKGDDGEEGTQDDGVFENLTAAPLTLENHVGLDQAEGQSLTGMIQSGILDIHSQDFTIQSVGRFRYDHQSLTIRAVVQRYGDIKHWQELFAS